MAVAAAAAATHHVRVVSASMQHGSLAIACSVCSPSLAGWACMHTGQPPNLRQGLSQPREARRHVTHPYLPPGGSLRHGFGR
jgi:hypothetical protein